MEQVANRALSFTAVGVACSIASCASHEPACSGASCAALTFSSPEGGEIRVEYVGTPSGAVSRGIAFFKSAQTPEATPFPLIAPAGGGVCNDLAASPMWPTAAPARATEIDVGELSIIGGGKTFSFTKQTNYTDFLGRMHGVAYQFEDASSMVTPSTLSDVVMSGSAASPMARWAGQLGMPAAFKLIPPELPSSLVIPLGEDFSVTWEQPAQTIGQRVLGLVAFLDGNGTLTQLCLSYASGGGLAVPKDIVGKIPAKGTLVRGHTTHQLREFPPGRRVDVIGTWCYATPYTVL